MFKFEIIGSSNQNFIEELIANIWEFFEFEEFSLMIFKVFCTCYHYIVCYLIFRCYKKSGVS